MKAAMFGMALFLKKVYYFNTLRFYSTIAAGAQSVISDSAKGMHHNLVEHINLTRGNKP
jgi:hypothetical protein